MENKVINVAIIGCGYWGPNYVRIINSLNNCNLKSCCDLSKSNLAKMKKICHPVTTQSDFNKTARSSDIDAVVIATPPEKHYEIARSCLKHKKHVLVEKPFTTTLQDSKKLISLAEKNGLTLMAGHIYEYNPGVNKLKDIIKKGQLGKIYYAHAKRIGLGPIRKHASALWDLAVHDISIALYLLDKMPEKVTAVGESYIQKNVNDMVFLSLAFPSRVIYNIYASWIAPEKIRKTTIIGSKAMTIFDDVNKTETVKIYARSVKKSLLDSTPEYSDHQLVVSIGDIRIPKIEQSEPLKNQFKDFINSIITKKRPLADGKCGLQVVKVLEAAERSLMTRKAVKCR